MNLTASGLRASKHLRSAYHLLGARNKSGVSAPTEPASPELASLASLLGVLSSTEKQMPTQGSSSLPNSNAVYAQSKPSWDTTVAAAHRLVATSKSGSVINPAELLGGDLALLTTNIRRLLGSDHPVLKSIASYYFMGSGGKHIRPMLVLLVAQATSVGPTPLRPETPVSESLMNAPIPVNSPVIHFDPALPRDASSSTQTSTSNQGQILPTQRRLAEITEMIHTASLLHDDVIDVSLVRRAKPSVNAEYGNKMAILAGDFLLARASIALARLRNIEVVELLSTVISNLVEGEFMQLRNSANKSASAAAAASEQKSAAQESLETQLPASLAPASHQAQTREFTSDVSNQRFEYYLAKTYMKTASLIANSCKAAAVLGGSEAIVADAVYRYGRALGLAFQVVDDVLDFTVTADEMGKPVNADIKLGLATAPVLYAAEQFPELDTIIERGFKEDGDDALALRLVHQSNGIARTRDLAAAFCTEAVEAISVLPDSDAKKVLVQLTEAVLNRKH
ncbi:coq1 putative hexaprenyl diphosphate synthase [Chytriomyces hyalinus]|nr:coq1 putative hexaprenyl diphosphate synthase [Chytriomyces hyalinus]